EAFAYQDRIHNDAKTPAEPSTGGMGVDPNVSLQEINDPADRAALADTLMALLKSKLGHRTIRSFFAVDVASNGYRLWEPQMRAPKDSGTPLARHSTQTSAGAVTIDLLRYSDDEETHVRAYEWCAELREEVPSELPDAVAYGMAY